MSSLSDQNSVVVSLKGVKFLLPSDRDGIVCFV